MFKIIRFNCCGLDVHKTWIYACIGITDANGRTEYKESRFKSFSYGLRNLADWLAKYSCTDVCMESSGKYWIPVFNVLEESCYVVLAHPKYTKPQKGNKTDRKDARWICDLFMCDMIKPSFIPPAQIRQLRDLMRYLFKLTNMLTGEKNRALNCLTVSNLKLDDVFTDVFGKSSRSIISFILEHPGETFDEMYVSVSLDFTSCSIRAATPARAESIISAFFSNAVQSVRAAITTFLSARILFLSTRSVLKALPFQHCFSSACPTITVYLNKSENAPPVKSGALYQNTVPLPHLKHRLILMCQFGVSFFIL